MLIICGGYEGVLLGLETDLKKCSNIKNKSDNLETNGTENKVEGHDELVTQTFRILCSQGSIKCMSLSNNVLACGGSDETLQVYNIEKRKKHGEIMLPEGFITSVAVFGGITKGFILLGNEHGDISMFMTNQLSFTKSFNGHKKQITGLSVHSEGKTFVSTGADGYLRLWDLISKTCVFNTKLNFTPTTVQWSTGSKYLLGSENEVLVCSTEDDSFYSVGEEGQKVSSCCWFGEHVVLGFKSGEVSVYRDKRVAKGKIHTKRVKSVTTKQDYVFSGDSEGNVVCWRFEEDKLEVVWKHEIGFRLNVMVA